MQSAQRSLNKTAANFRKIGAGLTVAITAPLVAIGAQAVKTFANFEQELAKVKAISGATENEFRSLEKLALDLGASTRFAASEVGQLELNLSKLGFTPQEIIKSSEAILDLAVATGEDLAQSATVAASTLRGFQLDASEAGRVADVMAKSFSSSALDLSKFETAMSVVAPVAKTAGVSLEQVAGQLAVLTNAGIDASTAGTGLRNILLDTAASGLSVDEALSLINNSVDKNVAALDLFGKRGATVAAVLSDNISQAKEFSLVFENAGGAAEKMADIMDNTLQGTLLRLKSATEALSISFGEQLAPFVRFVAEFLSDIAIAFKNLNPTVKKFLVIFGGIAAAVGPLLALAGTILPAIGTGFALLTGPIGLIAAGLTAIGVIIYKNWAPIKKTLVDIANYFVDLYNESTVFRLAVEGIRTSFNNIYDTGAFVFGVLGDIITTLGKNIKSVFVNAGEAIKAVLTGDFNELPKILAKNFAQTTANFKELINTATKDFEVLKGEISDNIEEGIDRGLNNRHKLLSDNVDTSEVEEKVKDGVSKAIQEGTSEGFGRAKTAKLKIDATGLAAVGNLDIGGQIADTLQVAEVSEKTKLLLEKMLEFREGAREILESAAQDFISGFAQILGAIASGNAGFSSLGSFLLGTVGQVLINLGKLAIQVSVTIEAIKKALQTLNPVVAAIAGAAAIALGTFIKNQAASFAGNYADGGIVPGASFSGDRLIAGVNSGELILNIAQQKNLAAAIRSNSAPVILQPGLRFSGREMQVFLERVDNQNKRST